MNDEKHVLLVGYFGFGNFGDETALSLIKEKLSLHRIKYQVYAPSKSPGERLLGLKAALSKSRAVVFCGGNLLQNETSNLSLIYYLYIIALAKGMCIPTFFVASGIGKLTGIGKTISRSALSGVDFFAARTIHDAGAAIELGANPFVMPDVCFTLTEIKREKKPEFAYIPKKEDIALEVRLAKIARELSLSPSVIPMQHEYDFALCSRIAERMDSPLCVFYSTEELLEYLSQCHFTVSERLHGGIFSLIAHTPAFLYEKSEKCYAHIEYISLLAKDLCTASPILPISELSAKKIKELGAQSSEFSKILTYLKDSSDKGFIALCDALSK